MCADDRPLSPRRTRWWLLAVIAVIVLVPAALVARHVNQGSPTNESRAFALRADGSRLKLGSLGGEVYNATDVNARDEVVGAALRSDGAMHAFVSRGGKMTDLGTLGGDTSWATAINEAGQVVGYAMTADGVDHAFLWQNGTMTDLLPASGVSGGAVDVNERGQVLCMITTPAAVGQAATYEIKPWEKGVLTDLGGLAGSHPAVIPLRINDRGQVLTVAGDRLLLWENGSATEVGKTSGGSYADLTEKGQVYYARRKANGGEGWVGLLESGRSTNLGALGGYLAWPNAANEGGEIVGVVQVKPGKLVDGTINVPGEQRAFRWKDGKFTLLRVGGDSSQAVAINSKGTVVGSYYFW
jgi:probable HAF family extracellular repeat protein